MEVSLDPFSVSSFFFFFLKSYEQKETQMTLTSSLNLIIHCFKEIYAQEVYLSKCAQQICNFQLELLGLYVLGAMTAKDLV